MTRAATIERDDFGIAHITAETEEAAFFAVGYAQCEDRLEQLLRNYLLVRGELAAAFGPGALGADLRVRRWLISDEARRGYRLLSPEVRACHDAFVAGVRRYMADHPSEVPAWAPPIEPWQPLALNSGLFFWAYAFNDGLAALFRSGVTPDEDIASLVEVPKASNGWVVMPSRTADGALMLLSDPHGELGGTIETWELTIEAGELHSFGQSIVGTPIPMWGHTAHTAWAMTTGGPSVSDCYAVVTHPDDPLRYEFDGETRQMDRRPVQLRVAGEDQPRLAVFDYTLHNGVLCPVVARADGLAYAVATPYMHVPTLLEEQLYRWHHAGGVDDMLDALRPGGMFVQNLLLGDADGRAAYVRTGRVPRRPEKVDWRLPLDGNTAATEWLGIHPLEDLLQIADPDSGFLQNCNVAPDTMTTNPSGTGLDHSKYPDYIVNDDAGRTHTRGRRAFELLSATDAATVDHALAWALDEKWLDVDKWQAALVAAQALDLPWDDAADALFEGIQAFDGVASADSIGALRYYYFRRALGLTSQDEPEAVRDLSVAVEGGEPLRPDQYRRLHDAIVAAAAEMVERHGTTDVAFGDVFRVGRGGRTFPGRGAFFMTRRPTPEDTNVPELLLAPLRLAEYHDFDKSNERIAWFGGRSLLLTVFGDPVRSFACTGFGQSHDPESPHHVDQAQLFSEHRLRPTYFDRAARAGHIRSTLELEPDL